MRHLGQEQHVPPDTSGPASLQLATGPAFPRLPEPPPHKYRLSDCLIRVELSGLSGKSRGYWRASDAGLAAWTVSAAMSPAEGVTMGVPVDSCLHNRMGDILPSLEALPGQRQ